MDLKTKLIENNFPEADVKRFLSYVNEAKATAEADDKPFATPEKLYSWFIKYLNVGLILDGVNVILAGPNRTVITYHGFTNKILQTYPESQIDIQLVREGDDFKVAKESGSVIYTHTIANPFEDYQSHPIIGAYAVIKNKRGEKFEALNSRDYQEMRKGSKTPATWDKWPSEFWLKCVTKRICKRYFYDIVADIDKVDNDDIGVEYGSTKEKKDDIVNAAAGTDTQRRTKNERMARPKRKESNSIASADTSKQGQESGSKSTK